MKPPGEVSSVLTFPSDFDQALLDDNGDFTASEGVFKPVTEENGKREGFAKFMGTRRMGEEPVNPNKLTDSKDGYSTHVCPLNLSSIHEEGAARRFKCFFRSSSLV